MVECWTWGRRDATSRHIGGTVLLSLDKTRYHLLVIVQPRKTGKRPDMTDKVLTWK